MEVLQGRISRTEIIDGEADAHICQVAHSRRDLVNVQDDSLRNFHFQPTRLYVRLRELLELR